MLFQTRETFILCLKVILLVSGVFLLFTTLYFMCLCREYTYVSTFV